MLQPAICGFCERFRTRSPVIKVQQGIPERMYWDFCSPCRNRTCVSFRIIGSKDRPAMPTDQRGLNGLCLPSLKNVCYVCFTLTIISHVTQNYTQAFRIYLFRTLLGANLSPFLMSVFSYQWSALSNLYPARQIVVSNRMGRIPTALYPCRDKDADDANSF